MHVRFFIILKSSNICRLLRYIKPSHMESSEFLEDILAGDGSQYIVPGATPSTLEELVDCYRASDHYKDIMRTVNQDDVKHTYWVESETGLGLSLKTPIKNHRAANPQPSRERGNKSLHVNIHIKAPQMNWKWFKNL